MPDRRKVTFSNLVYLLQSRRRQAAVFGPAAMMLLLGVLFALGALAGAIVLHDSPLNLVALALGALAAFTSLNIYRQHRHDHPQRTRSILIAGFAVSFGSVLLLTGGNVGVLWSLLLAVLGLNLILAPIDDA